MDARMGGADKSRPSPPPLKNIKFGAICRFLIAGGHVGAFVCFYTMLEAFCGLSPPSPSKFLRAPMSPPLIRPLSSNL